MSDAEHRIYLLGQIGKALFNSRLHRDEDIRKGRALMVYPQPTPEEEQNILGLASLLNQLQGTALLQHPKLPLVLATTRDCSPRQVFLFTQGETTFHMVEEAWASNIFEHLQEERTDSVSVPVVSVEKLLKQYRPTILAIDIQGAELGLFNQLPLDSVRELVVAIHTPLIGEKATAETTAAILRQGFELRDIAGWVSHFSRP